jgi:hypothetical protein
MSNPKKISTLVILVLIAVNLMTCIYNFIRHDTIKANVYSTKSGNLFEIIFKEKWGAVYGVRYATDGIRAIRN